jgi:replicative superfamily II helicase
MLDVQQIFGRAGRPQFEDSGEGIILTTHDKLAHYLGMLTHQVSHVVVSSSHCLVQCCMLAQHRDPWYHAPLKP